MTATLTWNIIGIVLYCSSSPCPLPFPAHRCLFGRRCSSAWCLPCPPAVPDSQTCPCVDGWSCQDQVWAAQSSPPDWSRQNLPVSAPSLSLPIPAHLLGNMNTVKNHPLLLTGIRWQSFGCMLSLLFPDRQLCFTLIAIYLLSSSL